MEIISLKMTPEMLSNIDKSLKPHNFNTRTEFIRESIREKLENLAKDELIMEFLSNKGKSKKRTTSEENKKTRDTVSKELIIELEKRFR